MPLGMTLRQQLVAWLTPVLPDGWKLIQSERNYDVLNAVGVQIIQQEITRTPQAPQGAWTFSYVVRLISSHTEFEPAEFELDEDVLTLWAILEDLPNVNPTDAKKILADPQHMGYDVTVTILTKRDPS